MPKLDPKGEVPNPIRAKLAHEITRPLTVLPPSPPPIVTSAVETLAASSRAVTVALPAEPEEGATIERAPIAVQRERAESISTRLAKPKKVLFTVAEQKENDLVVSRIGEAIGSDTLGWSHVNRAFWSLLRRAEEHMERHRSRAPKLTRPSNGNPIELANFEDALAEYLLMLFKDMPRR